MIEITAIRVTGGKRHEHITHVLWRSGAATGQCPSAAVVEWLGLSAENKAVVADGRDRVPVEAVRPDDAPAYLRAHANGAWTDDLLTLPKF